MTMPESPIPFQGREISAIARAINESGKTYTPESALPLPVADWLDRVGIQRENPIYSIMKKYPALAYGVETEIWKTPSEETIKNKGLIRHTVGVAVRALRLIDLFHEASDEQLNYFARNGFRSELFRDLPSLPVRDSILISHYGDVLARHTYLSSGKAWSNRAWVMYQYLKSASAPQILLDLQLGEMFHMADPKDRNRTITEGLSYPQFIVPQQADWMFTQKPMSIWERFEILTTNPTAATYLPTLRNIAVQFDSAVISAFGRDTLSGVVHTPDPPWAMEILDAYAAQVGQSRQQMFGA